ncbi:MFS general substrate transporter [Rhizodiscina lignyota]|uniref:MFS general substrate transporter n=1 Tax=Rhizodiscina lignyota TaxID=1504668 RepID=A0A9P4M4P0_9PEZI|nr:MFS general substrate transporter [Rhizodiscina lignyota]
MAEATDKRQSHVVTSEELDGGNGVYIDGKIVLIPQPSDDPNDPLNWSWLKKHLVFASLLPGCFLTDWVITWGTTLFVAQVPTFHMAPPQISHSISGAIFMQGPGGLLAVPLCQRFGRLPVLFWSQFLTLICTIGATYAKGYAGFTACRTLQGFFGAAPQVIGLSMIHDMFFFHERARKINIWGFSFLIGPYLGPFVSGFIITKLDWRHTFGVLCGFYGFSVLMILLFGDETLFDRSEDRKPIERKGIAQRVNLMIGIAGISESHGRPGVWEVTKDLFGLLLRPYLLLPTFGFVTWITMWTIGIVSTITIFLSPPPQGIGPYAFSPTAVSLLFFAPMIGTVFAEFWGHWFNDFLCGRYIRTHGGKYKPEHRLWGVYPAWILGILGLVILGESLQHKYHWIGLAFGWGLNCFSTLGTMVAISAYLLDVFPQQAALASAWINAFRTVGGFCVVYLQTPWVANNGPAVTFGCQAAIVAFFIVSIAATQKFGEKWRAKFPPPTGSRTS